MPAVSETERGRDRGDLILGLHENAAVFRQLDAKGLHDGGPWRDRITGTVTHAGSQEPVGEDGIAVARDLGTARARGRSFGFFEAIETMAEVLRRVSVTRVERQECV